MAFRSRRTDPSSSIAMDQYRMMLGEGSVHRKFHAANEAGPMAMEQAIKDDSAAQLARLAELTNPKED